MTAINTRGVQSAGAVQTITTVIKLIPLVAVATLGLFYVNWANLAPRVRSSTATTGWRRSGR